MPTYTSPTGQTTTVTDAQLASNPTYWSGVLAQGGFKQTATPAVPVPSVVTSEKAATLTNENLDKLNYSQGIPTNADLNKPGEPFAKKTTTATGTGTGTTGTTTTGTGTTTTGTGTETSSETAGMTPDQLRVYNANKELTAGWEADIAKMEQYRSDRDVLNNQIITNIQSKYANLARMQEKVNATEEAMVRIGGLRSGRDRYAGEIQAGIMSAAQSAGIQRLSDLAAEEQDLIIKARIAASDEDYKMLNDIMTKRDEIRKNKLETLTEIMKNNVELEKLAEKKAADAAEALRNQVKDNREMQKFALDNRIYSPFYEIGGNVFSTKTGMPVNDPETYKELGGVGDASDIQHVTGDNADNYAFVLDLRKQYPDAGITLTDDPATATAKLAGSRIYQDKVRGPAGGGAASSAGFANATVEKNFREDAVSMQQQIRAGTVTAQDAYNDLRGLYSPAEVTDDAIKSFLGITAAGSAVADISAQAPEYGTDIFSSKQNFQNTSLAKRYAELKKIFPSMGETGAIREQLRLDGYPTSAINNITGDILGQAGDFFGQFLGQ